MLIPLKTFSGEYPRSQAQLLPDNAATHALDCDFTQGKLTGIRARSAVAGLTPPVGTKSMFVYDDAAQRFLFQNSWGPKWGDGGFFGVPYEYFYGAFGMEYWVITEPGVPLIPVGNYNPVPEPAPIPTPEPAPVAPTPEPTPVDKSQSNTTIILAAMLLVLVAIAYFSGVSGA